MNRSAFRMFKLYQLKDSPNLNVHIMYKYIWYIGIIL